jgi:hypothetical protein
MKVMLSLPRFISLFALFQFVNNSMCPAQTYPLSLAYVQDGGGVPLLSSPSAMAKQDNYLYVMNLSGPLEIFDVSDPELPKLRGSFKPFGARFSIYASGKYVYNAFEEISPSPHGGLQIIDVSNPSSPFQIGKYTSSIPGAAYSVFISGSYAYLANGVALEIIDISNPLLPFLAGSIASPVTGATPVAWLSVFVSGNHAYLVGPNRLDVADISNPSLPKFSGSISDDSGGTKIGLPNAFLGPGIFVSGNYAFIAGRTGLEIIDVSTSNAPKHKSNLTISSYPSAVYVSGNYAYVSTASGIEIIDISDLLNPFLKGELKDGAGGVWSPVCISGNFAYLGSNVSKSLQVIDLTNPALPEVVAEVSDQTGYGAQLITPVSVFFKPGDFVYAASAQSNALEIVDVTDPTTPNPLSSTYVQSPSSVFVLDDYAYLTSTTGNGVIIFDVTKPYMPVSAGGLGNGTGGAILITPRSIFVSGSYAYVAAVAANGDGVLEIIDISSPTSPFHAGYIRDGAGGALLNNPSCVYVSENYAYVTSVDRNAIEIIDVSSPTKPIHKASLINGAGGALLSSPSSVYISGKYAYVTARGNNALEIIDISNPAIPLHSGALANGKDGAMLAFPSSVFVSGNYACVTSEGSNALELIDVTNPALPLHVGSLVNGTGGAQLARPLSVYVSGNFAFVASFGSNALEIVKLFPKQNQSITFPQITDKTLGDPNFNLNATASSGQPVTFNSSLKKVTFSGDLVTLQSAGRDTIIATQIGDDNFNPAPLVKQTFCIKPAKPRISASDNASIIKLTSSSPSGNQWFLNGNPIAGATNSVLNVQQQGIYTVQAKVDDCVSVLSENFPVVLTEDTPLRSTVVTAYPNPAENYLEITGLKSISSNIHFYDVYGRPVSILLEKASEIYRADVQHLLPGIYLLRVQQNGILYQIKFFKK